MTKTTIGGSADEVRIPGKLRVEGNLDVLGDPSGIGRADLEQDTLESYLLAPEQWKVWDDMDSPLPSTPATDDLGLIGGTFGTDSPSVQTEDLKTAGATNNRARRSFALPPEYDAGQTVVVRVHAGMLTTVADNSATVDVEVYKGDKEAGIGADLVSDAAQSINSLVLADKDFTIDAAGLSPGDVLDLRITTAVNDAATGTAVKAILGAVEVLLDIKG